MLKNRGVSAVGLFIGGLAGVGVGVVLVLWPITLAGSFMYFVVLRSELTFIENLLAYSFVAVCCVFQFAIVDKLLGVKKKGG